MFAKDFEAGYPERRSMVVQELKTALCQQLINFLKALTGTVLTIEDGWFCLCNEGAPQGKLWVVEINPHTFQVRVFCEGRECPLPRWCREWLEPMSFESGEDDG